MMNEERKSIEKIRRAYSAPVETDLDRLKALDKKVKRPVQVFAIILGILGSLLLGLGMSLAMKVIGDMMLLGVVLGVIGILLVSANYTLYRALLDVRKRRYSAEILTLSEALMNEQ